MSLGKSIKLCREQKSMTLDNLAKKAGLSIPYISLLEQGKRDPSFSTVEKIAQALNIPLAILMFLSKDKNEFESIHPELAEKLSLLAFKLLEN